jgi:hypothetical protein
MISTPREERDDVGTSKGISHLNKSAILPDMDFVGS